MRIRCDRVGRLLIRPRAVWLMWYVSMIIFSRGAVTEIVCITASNPYEKLTLNQSRDINTDNTLGLSLLQNTRLGWRGDSSSLLRD